MRIAVASEGLDVSKHFSSCTNFNFYKVENNELVDSRNLPSQEHLCGSQANFLRQIEVRVLICGTISFTVSVVFNYVASMRYVFERRDDMSRRREFIIFVVLSIIGLILNDLFMWLFVSVWLIDYRIAKIIVTVLVAIWNFVTRKIFLEKH